MLVGEEIPLLIPFSVVFVVFILFTLVLFSDIGKYDYIYKTIDMQDIIYLKILQTYGDGFGGLNIESSKCTHLNRLNLTSSYSIKMSLDNGACWSNFGKFSKEKMSFKRYTTNNGNLTSVVIEIGK